MTTITTKDQELWMTTPRYFYATPFGIAEWVEQKGLVQAMREISKLRRAHYELVPNEKLVEVVIKDGKNCYLMTHKGDMYVLGCEIPNLKKLQTVTLTDDFLTITGLISYPVLPTDF